MRPASDAAGTKVGASFAASTAKALALSRSVSCDLVGARRQHHRALAPISFLVHGAPVAFEQRQRAGPVAGQTAEFEHRLAGPAERRAFTGGLLGESVGARRIAAAAGLDIEAVKSERLGVVAARHRTEERVGRVGVAAKLRRLRTQQERERFGGRDARDFSRMQARRG